MKMSFAEILKKEEETRAKKTALKIPAWSEPGLHLEFPSSLCQEQCSSEATARFKASLIGRAGRIADLTGGLGVDCWAFSSIASKVLHNEMDGPLSAAVERNFARLGIRNVTFSRYEISPDNLEWLPELKSFRPDWIFLDPARRDRNGRKVFLLEDCSPDLVGILPLLLECTGNIMVKLSPIADLSMVASRLGESLESQFVISLGGEVKELLCILSPGHSGEPSVTVTELDPGKEFSFTFRKSEEAGAEAVFADGITPESFLAEPSSVMLKAGCFNLMSTRFGLEKLAPSTHLFTADHIPPGSGNAFRWYRVLKTYDFGSAAFREVRKEFPAGNVTARNVPLTSDQLRARLGVREGDGIRIWGCTACGKKRILVTANI